MPDLEQILILDDAGLYVMLAILVVVVGFGILNTILMAVLERQRELGVMLALGLRPAAIFRVVYIESMLLAAVGLLVGLGFAVPIGLWMEAHPIVMGDELAGLSEFVGMEPVISTNLAFSIVWKSALVILGVATVAALYPALKASRANPVDALRSL
jgi:ABC-type lipoprotein release transport system permease subunit